MNTKAVFLFGLAFALPMLASATCQQRAPTTFEFSQNPGINPQGCFISGENFFVHGEITIDFLVDLKAALDQKVGIKRVVLSSPGGNYDIGVNFGKAIHAAGLETLVPNPYTYCASSCTYAFQSGIVRRAHPKSLFAYHALTVGGPLLGQIYIRDCGDDPAKFTEQCQKDVEDMHQASLQGAVQVFNNLESLGVSHALYERYISQPENPNWLKDGEFTKLPVLILHAKDLDGYGIITSLQSDFQGFSDSALRSAVEGK